IIKEPLQLHATIILLDTALIQAIAFLKTSDNDKALILIADEKLPESYEVISRDGNYSFAFSCLISKKDPNIYIDVIDSNINKDENSIIDFIKFISTDTSDLELGKIKLIKK
ncbi:beta-ketoacyl synthase chain length factor, partial [Brachyspira hampsonii]|uniref:beta-ketoacyl synthase chain length factor n=1 Tax=Brachyspira hampsonii TaxID=1287055 RepID=UPI001F4986AA